MAGLFSSSESEETAFLKVRDVSPDLLTDFLLNLTQKNKDYLRSLTEYNGNYLNKAIIEHIFLITNELRQDPQVGYHAIELLQRFIAKYTENLFTTPTSQGTSANLPRSYDDGVDSLKDKLPLIIFSCIQLASKISLRSHMIDNNTAARFLRSVGCNISKKALLESELMVLKMLNFNLNVPNPLTYVETVLQVLGHNEPSIPMVRLHQICQNVLQFISLKRTDFYESLLKLTIECANPSSEQRIRFVPVTEDYMLLGVGVIAVAAFIYFARKWEEVFEELSRITGISQRSITDFVHAALLHLVGRFQSM